MVVRRPQAKTINTTVVTTTKRRRTRRRKGARVPRPVSTLNVHTEWADCMNDPFNNPPVKLGLGTMVNTSIYTFYQRSSFTANATDGTFSIALYPRSVTGASGWSIDYNNGGAASTAWGNINWANFGPFTSMYGLSNETRVIGGGLRVMPSIAATAAPGELFAGYFPAGTVASVEATTALGLQNVPSAHVGISTDGAMVCTRPQDLDSFTFQPDGATTTGTTTHWSIPFVTGSIPPGATVYWEAILHVEVLPGTNAPGAFAEGDSVDYRSQLSNLYGSIEGLFYKTETLLENAVRLTSRFTNLAATAVSVGGLLLAGGSFNRSNASYGRNRLIP